MIVTKYFKCNERERFPLEHIFANVRIQSM